MAWSATAELALFAHMQQVWNQLNEAHSSGRKLLAVLIDPDKVHDKKQLQNLIELCHHSGVNFLFVGGSLLVEDRFDQCVSMVKSLAKVPVVLFPGNAAQVSAHADALLFLSLISGRNADLLIGQHVLAAPRLKRLPIEIIPTGYMLVDCGKATTATYISQTLPLPYDKPEIAAATAMAGEMLGLKCLYVDGGSGAQRPVHPSMIDAVKSHTQLPLIVGGGIRTEADAENAFKAGADLVVVGTAIEESPEILFQIAASRN